MSLRFFPVLTLSALASSAALFAAPVLAADPSKAEAKADAPKAAAADAPDATPDAAKAYAPATGDAAAKPVNKDAALVADAEAGGSPVEEPGKTYYFVGARYRGIIVPKFMMNLFGEGGRTVYVNAFGPEFGIRKNAFEYSLSAWYAAYSMEPTPFKASSDGPEAWEIVESKVKVLYLTSDFLWSHDFTPEVAFNYGVGAGFGIVWGDLFRTQAAPVPGANANTGDGFVACNGPTNAPGANASFCGTDNDHYRGYTEKSWSGGGSKPIIFPWLALQTGLRFKPHRNFAARLDAGFGTSGFFLGLGADYGL